VLHSRRVETKPIVIFRKLVEYLMGRTQRRARCSPFMQICEKYQKYEKTRGTYLLTLTVNFPSNP